MTDTVDGMAEPQWIQSRQESMAAHPDLALIYQRNRADAISFSNAATIFDSNLFRRNILRAIQRTDEAMSDLQSRLVAIEDVLSSIERRLI